MRSILAGTRRLERHFNVTMRVTPLSRSRLAGDSFASVQCTAHAAQRSHAPTVEITGTQKEQVQLCQLYLEGTFEHMQPVVRPPRSHSAINNTGSPSSMDSGTSLATSLHTQLGSSSSLAQRYCIRRDSHSPSKQRDGHEVHQQIADALSARDQLSAFLIESDAVSPSAGGASIYRSVMKRMPTATALFATVQQRHEQQQELQHQQSHQHQQPHHHHQSAPAAAAASAAAKTIDGIHYHLLNERVSCIEAAIASLATTVSQLVQLLSAAADSSPQAAATIAAAAVQLTADIPVDSAPQSDTSRLSHSIGGASVGLEAASPAYEISNYYSQPTRGADSASCLEAVHNDTGSHCDADRSPSIATPEFHLRRKIVRVSDLHERLAAIPSGLPAHAAVRVTRQ